MLQVGANAKKVLYFHVLNGYYNVLYVKIYIDINSESYQMSS